jgi:selenocysteine-specific elongation factor
MSGGRSEDSQARDARKEDPTDMPLVVGTAGQSATQPDPTDTPLVVGTAGHIDHGKTALITLLTGTNTDRLREERERGISIELGYAELVLPGGRRLSVVDVPGHERFVRTMVAGATGVDLFLLVVAADDGVMPQTVEHLAIIELLGVESGVVALTKADLVDEELLELARADVEGLLAGARYEATPIVTVSSKDGRGMPELLEALEEAAAAVGARRAKGPARLPVDRVFSLKGIGTVATGTLWRGEIGAGDVLCVEPGGEQVTVRDVQVHEHDEPVGRAGQRVGVNLRGAELRGGERGALRRGAWLAAPAPAARTTSVFDAWLELLPGAPGLSSGDEVRFHHGTGQSVARVQLLDRHELSADANGPGAPVVDDTKAAAGSDPARAVDERSVVAPRGAPVRVRLEGPDLVEPSDRFIVRALSPAVTMGGGTVLDAEPRRWRDRAAQVRYLTALRRAAPAEAVAELAATAGAAGITAPDLAATTIGDSAVKVLSAAGRHGELEVAASGRRWFAPGTMEALESALLDALESRARERPDRPVLAPAEAVAAVRRAAGVRQADGGRPSMRPAADSHQSARSAAEGRTGRGPSSAQVPDDVVAETAARLVAGGRAVQTADGWAHPSAGALDPRREELAATVAAALAAERFSPPTLGSLLERLGGERRDISMVLDVLVRRGEAERVKEDLYFATAAVDAARERLVTYIGEHGSISLAAFRDLLDCGRRNAQALLEHFDGEGLTRRDGEQRILRRRHA